MFNRLTKILAGASAAALLLGPFMSFAAPGGPTVTLSSSAPFTDEVPTNVTWVSPIPFSVSLSSSTTGFDASDVHVDGALGVTNFSGSGSSYTFSVVPGDGDPAHANQLRYIRVQIGGDLFDGNQESNAVEFWFDPAAKPVDNTAPIITFIDPSPANGSTLFTADNTATTTDFTFAFTVNEASSTTQCSIVEASSTDSFYICGSPQNFSDFGAGAYRFSVKATDDTGNTATSSRTFAIAVSSTTPSTSLPPPTPTPSPAQSSGGGGGGQIVGSSPTAPSAIAGQYAGAGSVIPGVPNTGSTGTGSLSTINPNPIIPTGNGATLPVAYAESGGSKTTSAKSTSVSTTKRSTSLSRASTNTTPTVAVATTTSTVTPGVPNTGTSTGAEASSSLLTGQAAATANAGANGGTWIWAAIILIILVAIGWLFYRSA